MTTRTIQSPAGIAARPAPRHAGILGWLLDLDNAFREREHFRRLDDAALRDVGLTTADQERARLGRPEEPR